MAKRRKRTKKVWGIKMYSVEAAPRLKDLAGLDRKRHGIPTFKFGRRRTSWKSVWRSFRNV